MLSERYTEEELSDGKAEIAARKHGSSGALDTDWISAIEPMGNKQQNQENKQVNAPSPISLKA